MTADVVVFPPPPPPPPPPPHSASINITQYLEFYNPHRVGNVFLDGKIEQVGKIYKEYYREEIYDEKEEESEEDAFQKWMDSFPKDSNFGYEESTLFSRLPNLSVILSLSMFFKLN